MLLSFVPLYSRHTLNNGIHMNRVFRHPQYSNSGGAIVSFAGVYIRQPQKLRITPFLVKIMTNGRTREITGSLVCPAAILFQHSATLSLHREIKRNLLIAAVADSPAGLRQHLWATRPPMVIMRSCLIETLGGSRSRSISKWTELSDRGACAVT